MYAAKKLLYTLMATMVTQFALRAGQLLILSVGN